MSEETSMNITSRNHNIHDREGDNKEPSCLYDLRLLITTYHFLTPGLRENISVYRCSVCNQLWKIRFRWNGGAGSDNIWLRPGENKGGYRFTWEEASRVESIPEERYFFKD